MASVLSVRVLVLGIGGEMLGWYSGRLIIQNVGWPLLCGLVPWGQEQVVVGWPPAIGKCHGWGNGGRIVLFLPSLTGLYNMVLLR